MLACVSSEPLPSATVVVIRDGRDALELLLLERSRRKPEERPGPWVFPGGKVDAVDLANLGADGLAEADIDPLAGARRAAVRETCEEAALLLEPGALVPISRWITPDIAPRRFDTWFFVGVVDADCEVRVDGGEIASHRWLAPSRALDAHARGDLRLAPPTFVTVTWLAGYSRTDAALTTLDAEPVVTFRPRICGTREAPCILYAGDAGYEVGDPEAAGERHRLFMGPGSWRYERTRRG